MDHLRGVGCWKFFHDSTDIFAPQHILVTSWLIHRPEFEGSLTYYLFKELRFLGWPGGFSPHLWSAFYFFVCVCVIFPPKKKTVLRHPTICREPPVIKHGDTPRTFCIVSLHGPSYANIKFTDREWVNIPGNALFPTCCFIVSLMGPIGPIWSNDGPMNHVTHDQSQFSWVETPKRITPYPRVLPCHSRRSGPVTQSFW